MVAVQSELWATRWDQWTKGSSPSPGLPWLLWETEISQSYISEICFMSSVVHIYFTPDFRNDHRSLFPDLTTLLSQAGYGLLITCIESYLFFLPLASCC